MGRRSRSGVADYESEAEKMSFSELEGEISRCIRGFETGGMSQGQKAFFKRLIWLEAQREAFYDIPAPKRKFRER